MTAGAARFTARSVARSVARSGARAARLMAAGALVLAGCGDDPGTPSAAWPLPEERAFLDAIDRTRGTWDLFRPLRDPPLATSADAPGMSPGETVLGIVRDGVAVCYPTLLLNSCELVEHRVGGTDLLVVWCPLCHTGVAHVRELDGRPIAFGHSGWLWNGILLLYDHETRSLWHPVAGAAWSGPLRGRSLERIPVTQTTFAAWCAEHPDTLVVAKPRPGTGPGDFTTDPYAARDRMFGFGYGIDVGSTSRLYRLDDLAKAGPAEEEVEGVPVVVAADPGARSAVAWDRRVGGRTLSFTVDTAGEGGRPLLREAGGGRAWFLRSGRPAPSAGGDGDAPALVPILGTVWEDAAWAQQHPGSRAWAPPGR